MARSVVKWTLQFSTYHMQTGNSSCMGWAAAFPRGAHSSVGKESACNAGDLGSIPGLGRSAGGGIGYPFQYSWTSHVAQLVKNLPAKREAWVRSLSWEDPLENEWLPTPVFWPWEFHGPYMGLQRVGHDWVTFTLHFFIGVGAKINPCLQNTHNILQETNDNKMRIEWVE